MKEIISAILVIVGLVAGTRYLKDIHDGIRKAALEKAAKGLPSLTEMNRALQNPRRTERKN